jgi:hypothetical protein
MGDRLAVKSDNPNYDTWYVEKDVFQELEVHGRVLAALPMSRVKRFN